MGTRCGCSNADPYQHCTFRSQLPAIRSIRKDLRDMKANNLEGFDVVMHLAALSNDPLENINPDLTYDTGCRTSVNLAKLTKQIYMPRYIFSSSCSTYRVAAGSQMLSEEVEFSPVTPMAKRRFSLKRKWQNWQMMTFLHN